jgi:hypothetical protein
MVCVDKDNIQSIVNQVSNIASAVNGSPINGASSTATGTATGAFGANGLLSALTGSTDYKSKHHSYLLKRFTQQKTAYQNAPIDVSRAEKNLYLYNKGEPGGETLYNNIIIDRFSKTAATFKENTVDRQQQFMAGLIQSIKQYQATGVFASQMKNLLKLRQAEQDDLKKKIDYYQTVLQTSERKVVYENDSKDNIYTYQRIMIFLYYAALVCFIIFGNFIPDRLYLKSSVWIILVIVAMIPLLLNLFIMWIFLLYDTVAYWFSELPHKDIAGGLAPSGGNPPGPP